MRNLPGRKARRCSLSGFFAAAACLLSLGAALAPGQTAAERSAPATETVPLDAYVRQFESSYHNVRTLRASFTQEYSAWNRTRVEAGQVSLERGGKMRWEYRKPEEKLFLSDGKDVLLYVPSEKQLTRTPVSETGDIRLPLELLVSRPNVRRIFSKIEFAGPDVLAQPGDRVLRAYPKRGAAEEYRDVLVELTPEFDIRRLVVTYPDQTTMTFIFDLIDRNVPLSPSLFEFVPPAGTEIIQQ